MGKNTCKPAQAVIMHSGCSVHMMCCALTFSCVVFSDGVNFSPALEWLCVFPLSWCVESSFWVYSLFPIPSHLQSNAFVFVSVQPSGGKRSRGYLLEISPCLSRTCHGHISTQNQKYIFCLSKIKHFLGAFEIFCIMRLFSIENVLILHYF